MPCLPRARPTVRQSGKQLLAIAARGCAHLVGYGGEALLDVAKMRPARPGQRDAEKGQRPIGFDFQKPLRQRAKPDRRQSAIEDENARQAVAVLAKIGDDIGHAIFDARVAPADRIEAIYVFRGLFRPRHDVQPNARHDGSRRRESVLEGIFAHRISGFGIKGRAPQIGREFRVLLAMQIALLECQAVKRRLLIRQRRAHTP